VAKLNDQPVLALTLRLQVGGLAADVALLIGGKGGITKLDLSS
jgi:hypothetical protein